MADRSPSDLAPSDPVPSDLAQRLAMLAPTPGVHESESWPGMLIVRIEEPTERALAVYDPCVCVVAQGAKNAWLNDTCYRYDAEHYLTLSVPLPLECEVVDASPEVPYLALVLGIDTEVLGGLLSDLGTSATHADIAEATDRGVYATHLPGGVADAILRLIQALEDPSERRVLAPAAYRELLFRILQGDQAAPLRAAGLRDGRAFRIGKVVRYLHENFDQPIDVATLAGVGSMSASTLHNDFRAVTDDTPLGYLKKIRLHRARALVQSGMGAAEAAYHVGYGSASQFSREFKRAFGHSPRDEAARNQSEV